MSNARKPRILLALLLLEFAFVVLPATNIWASQSLRLWNTSAPGAKGDAPADILTIDIYLPPTNSTQTGVLICPGGGYSYLSLDNEGSQIAAWLNQHNVAAFVLHYRVKPYGQPAPLLDAARAMRLIRSHAIAFHLAPGHIGVWGFSAGGHVAAILMTTFDTGLPSAARDEVGRTSDRPNSGILAYPVISMDPAITHPGSHDILLGQHASPALEQEFSADLNVQPDSPPAFLFATSDDDQVPVFNSIRFCQAYISLKLPIEMHLFEHGEHGVGLGVDRSRLEHWPDLLATWMTAHGWMSDTSTRGEH